MLALVCALCVADASAQESQGSLATRPAASPAWISLDEDNMYVSGRIWDSGGESAWIANEMPRSQQPRHLTGYCHDHKTGCATRRLVAAPKGAGIF